MLHYTPSSRTRTSAHADARADAASRRDRLARSILAAAFLLLVIFIFIDQSGMESSASEHAEQNPCDVLLLGTDDHLLTEEQWAQAEAEAALAKAQEEAALAAQAEKERKEREKAEAEEKARKEEQERLKREEEKRQADEARKAKAAQLDLSEETQGSYMENAKKIYSILSAAGIPDINIAGVLGNWESESGLDPTSIEGIYNESYYIGERKREALADPEEQARKCFSSYAKRNIKINKSAYRRSNGEVWPGLGLGGFTGPAIDPLMSWAEKIDRPWYSLETQVSYSLKGYGRAKWFASWTTESKSAKIAAADFLHNWEGCHVNYSDRAAQARKWYDKMKDWKPDLEYGKKILSLG